MSERQFHFWGDAIINEVGTWANKTFPKSTPKTILSHMQEELGELTSCVDFYTDKTNFSMPEQKIEAKESLAKEMADVQLLLFHLAYKLAIDLPFATSQKFEINKKRQWNTEPEPEGHFKHKPGKYINGSMGIQEDVQIPKTLCTVCGIRWVDAYEGIDTCDDCLANQ